MSFGLTGPDERTRPVGCCGESSDLAKVKNTADIALIAQIKSVKSATNRHSALPNAMYIENRGSKRESHNTATLDDLKKVQFKQLR